KADASITVTGYSGLYDGAPHGATGSASGINNENLISLLHLGNSFTNVPGGTAHWTFDGNANYKSAAGDVTITINPAPSTAVVTFESGPYTYRGSVFRATAQVTGGGLNQTINVTYTGDCLNVSTLNGCTASAS